MIEMKTGQSHIRITGGSRNDQRIAFDVVSWFMENKMEDNGEIVGGIDINVEICTYDKYKCYGSCDITEDIWTPTSFEITVDKDQEIRDYVATIMHEMIHARQWVRNFTSNAGGEQEAEKYQYQYTDEFMKEQ